MATSGTIYSSYGNHTRFYFSWQLADQDIANNRSLIKWQAGIQGQSGYSAYWYSNSIKIYSIHIGGGSSVGSGTWSDQSVNNGSSVQLQAGSKWISHNSDGTKSISADLSAWLFDNGNFSASGSWSLPTIPRNSQVTTDAYSYTLGNPIQVITNRKSSSFTHTITIRMDNSSGTVLQTFNSVGSSVTWTPTSDQITTMQNNIPTSNNLNIYINQYNDQVKASSNVTVGLKLTEANPTFTDFTFKDSSSIATITGNNQVLVKGQSVLEVDIITANKMVALKGSTADHYSIAYDGTSELEAYSASATVSSSFSNPQTIGNRTILVSAYDSRNNSTTVSKNITVYDYVAPTIATRLTRENNFGTNTTVHIDGTYTPLNIAGADRNSPTVGTLQYRYQESGGTFGSWTTVTFTASSGTYSLTDFVISLDNTKKYNFEFHINDKFGQVTTTNSVDVGAPIVFIGQNSGNAQVGIGKMPETDGYGDLDVAGDITADGKLLGSNLTDSGVTYSPTVTGFSTAPPNAVYRYNLVGKLCTLFVSQPTNGTSNSTSFTIGLPFQAADINSGVKWVVPIAQPVDNGAVNTTNTGIAIIDNAGTVVTLLRNAGGSTWTASGGKRVPWFQILYETE